MSKKALAALEYNKNLDSVFVTEDEQVFVDGNAAINHSVSKDLDAEKIIEVKRTVSSEGETPEPELPADSGKEEASEGSKKVNAKKQADDKEPAKK